MKVIFSNLKRGEVKLRIENLDDLWYLSHIIELNDFVKGKTLRKIIFGEKEGKRTSIRKPIFAKIKVEKIDMSEFSNLRISGVVAEAPEDIPKGSYHTFNLEEGSIVTIIKEKWQRYHLDKLKESTKPISNILICVMDREESIFALLKRSGYTVLSRLKGNVIKKVFEEKIKGNFYSEIINKMKEYDNRYSFQSIILASPSFWKEDLMKELKDNELKDKIILATCSSVDESSISEILKRQETQFALKQDRIAKETNLVEELLLNIKKDDKAAYGIKEVELAINSGAVDKLLLTDNFIRKHRDKSEYYLIDELMKKTDQMKGEIMIISSEHDAGKKLDGLGGIGAILRYKLRY